jgi:hypothetical protein
MMDDLLDALVRLNARVDILERRLAVLEHSSEIPASSSIDTSTCARPQEKDEFAIGEAGSAFPVFGKALLGIAGAYLLRAVAESASFPKLAVVAMALAYAAMWLISAARAPLEARLARIVYAATSALILTPMLWELTLRFQFLPASITAALLAGFVVGAAALSWKRDLEAIQWVAVTAGVLSAVGLLFTTLDSVPFTMATQAMACAIEIVTASRVTRALRWFVALAADLATGVTLYVYSSPESARPSYPVVSQNELILLSTALFAIYGASISYRTAFRKRRITRFGIVQVIAAFLSAVFGILHFGPANGMLILGVACILLALGSYTVTFVCFDRAREPRNYHVFATWSTMLLLTGAFITLSPVWLALAMSAAAIAATILGRRTGRLTLEFHGLVYLCAGAYASGLLGYGRLAVAGAIPTAPGWLVWSVAASAVACYAFGGCYRGKQRSYRVIELLSAMLAVSAVLTFLVSLPPWLAMIGVVLAPSHVAVIRTLITCAVALVLSFSGSRWQRIELIWIAYGMLALVTAKLLFEDLRTSHPAAIAVSILLYAIALIAIPRVSRLGEGGKKTSPERLLQAVQNPAAE